MRQYNTITYSGRNLISTIESVQYLAIYHSWTSLYVDMFADHNNWVCCTTDCRITNSFENDFFNRCVSAWNSLPNSLVKSKYLASFKYNLKSIYLTSNLELEFFVIVYCVKPCRAACD